MFLKLPARAPPWEAGRHESSVVVLLVPVLFWELRGP